MLSFLLQRHAHVDRFLCPVYQIVRRAEVHSQTSLPASGCISTGDFPGSGRKEDEQPFPACRSTSWISGPVPLAHPRGAVKRRQNARVEAKHSADGRIPPGADNPLYALCTMAACPLHSCFRSETLEHTHYFRYSSAARTSTSAAIGMASSSMLKRG
jgi:hypothetical protein